jgi:hypothetical protein
MISRPRGRRLLNIVTYAPLLLGLILLIAGRATPELRGSFWIGVALLLISASCLIYAAIPGDGDLSDQQVAALQRLGIRYTPALGRAANALVGALLVAGAVWLLAA